MDYPTLREAICLAILEKVAPVANAVLMKIDAGPYHMLPPEELDPDELEVAERLAMAGLVRRLPATSRFPERFVLTSGGSHAIGTFAQARLHDR